MLREDLNSAMRVGGARPGSRWAWATTAVAYALLKPGVQAVLLHRLAHLLAVRLRVPVLPQVVYRLNYGLTNCDIGPRARIGAGFAVVHASGVVIHGETVAGRNLCVFSGVVIGDRFGDRPTGPPRLGDDVFLGAGAKVLGDIVVGDRSVVGANSVLLVDLPADHRAVGIPAAIRPMKGAAVG